MLFYKISLLAKGKNAQLFFKAIVGLGLLSQLRVEATGDSSFFLTTDNLFERNNNAALKGSEIF